MTADAGGPSGGVKTAERNVRTQPMIAPSKQQPATPTQPTARGRLIALALLVGAATLVVAAVTWPVDKPPDPEVVVPPVNVTIQTIAGIPEMPDTFDLTAVVDPDCVVRVAAEVPARIEKRAERPTDIRWRGKLLPAGEPLEEGEPVVAGQPILHLNRALLEARYEQARAQHEFDEIEFGRLSGLYKSATASKTELDNARTRRDVSKALLDAAREELDRTTVFAPIDGILNKLTVEVGEYASPGDCVAEIVSINPVKVTADVPEQDIHYLQLGESTHIFLFSPDKPEVAGQITYISELADVGTRTTRIEVTVPNPDYSLRSGQIVKVRLTRRVLNDVIMIPLDSVIPLENGHEVYVVDSQNQAQRRNVRLGFIRGRSVQILDGLTDGDRLIVAGQRYVSAGQAVAVVEER